MVVLLPVLGLAALWLTYEFWALLTGHRLITEIVRDAQAAYPPLGFLVGILSGALLAHFFWQ